MSDSGFPVAIGELMTCLTSLGVRPGDSLFTHTAFRSLYHGSSSPTFSQGSQQYGRDVIRALRESVGSNGVLMMPTEFLGDYQVDSFRGTEFDLRTARTNRGFLCNVFLESPGVRRSTGPIYNVAACGPATFHSVLDRHHTYAYAQDVGTPWWDFMERGGKIVYLGASLDSNSFIHMPEYVLKNEYPRPVFFNRPHTFRLIDLEGEARSVEAFVHAIRWGRMVVTKFMRFLNRKYGLLNEALIEDTLITVVDARAQYEALLTELNLGQSWYDAMVWGNARSAE